MRQLRLRKQKIHTMNDMELGQTTAHFCHVCSDNTSNQTKYNYFLTDPMSRG